MLYFQKTTANNAILAIWKIEEPISFFTEKLSDISLNNSKYLSISNEKRKIEYLATRNLIKEICGQEKEIAYTERGKPYLTDKSFQISISHTKDYAAIIIHSTLEVGIDVETKSERIIRLQSKFMHVLELQNSCSCNEPVYSLLHWSAKECLFKIMPEDKIDFIDHLRIEGFDPEEYGTIKAQELKTSEQQKFTVQYQVFSDFVLTCCEKN